MSGGRDKTKSSPIYLFFFFFPFLIHLQGGKQYFDSGDYNKSANRKDRQAIASHPHAMNPHLAQMRGIHKTQPSKLVAAEPKNPTKSPLAN